MGPSQGRTASWIKLLKGFKRNQGQKHQMEESVLQISTRNLEVSTREGSPMVQLNLSSVHKCLVCWYRYGKGIQNHFESKKEDDQSHGGSSTATWENRDQPRVSGGEGERHDGETPE